MKIAILGGSGYIGSKLCIALSEQGHEVLCLSRDAKKVERLIHENCKVLIHDINIKSSDVNLYKLFDSPDIVIDAAWANLDDYSSRFHIERSLQSHHENIENLIKHGLKNLTILGTCAEYGMQEGELSEEIETRPVTNYAIAKDLYRRKVFKLKESADFRINWARIFYFYGLSQPRSAIFSQLINANNSVFNMSYGEQIRDYLYIDEVIDYLCKIATSKHEIGLINVCSGIPLKLKSIVKNWVSMYELDVEINLGYYDYLNNEPFSFWGSVAKLKKFKIID
jgi:nucleoside-diphosphate-sugar epimerase